MNTGAERGVSWLGIFFVAGAAISWSTAGLFPRVVQTDVFTTLFWRSLLGGLSILLISLWLNQGRELKSIARLSAAEWRMSIQSSGAMLCFIAAFFFTSVADVVFIYSAFPIITLLLSAWILRSAVRPADALCALAVMLGMLVIVWGQDSLHNLLGTGLSFAATVLFALVTMGIKQHPQANMVKVTYMGTFLAALMMAPFSSLSTTSPADMAWLWLYGVSNVGLGFGLFYLGVSRIKPVLASLVCMLEIPLAPFLVYLLFGETVSTQSLIGGSVIVLAVLLNIASHGLLSRR